MWRKTRLRIVNPETGYICWGVDANRNYGHMWEPTDDVKAMAHFAVSLLISMICQYFRLAQLVMAGRHHFPNQKPDLYARS